MQKQKTLLLVVAVILIVGGVYVFTTQTKQSPMEDAVATEQSEELMIKTDTMEANGGVSDDMVEGDSSDEARKGKVEAKWNVEEGEKAMEEGKTTTVAPETPETMVKGSYEVYTPEKLALAETGDVVLFFHASWCPSCRGLNSNIESNSASIPDGVTILKTDYDKETELKKKYGVTYQHTLVQVSADGTMIKKWSGGPSLEKLIAEIQ